MKKKKGKRELTLVRSRKKSSQTDLANKEHFPFHQYKNTAETQGLKCKDLKISLDKQIFNSWFWDRFY